MPHDLVAAVPASPAPGLGAWTAPPADLAALASTTCVARLPELGVIAVRGADAVGFLQSQLTGDVAGLDASGSAPNGYCTPKGRLLATFDTWRDGGDVFLALPREVLPGVLKRLSMFVLRAKAKLNDDSAAWTLCGVAGADADGLLDAVGLGAGSGQVARNDAGLRRLARPDTAVAGPRALLAMPAASTEPAALAAARHVAPGVWWWTEVAAGWPTVLAATQEKFVPQMINFEVLGGVNFRKGCYPGQEIVARSQYLGKLRRRMSVARMPAGSVAPAGADVVWSERPEQPSGVVVMSATAPDGTTALLFEAPVDVLERGTLHVGDRAGPALAVQPLPYQLFDPTA